MIPILSASELRDWDKFTIIQEPISSLDLMEKAITQLGQWLSLHFSSENTAVLIACGPGNNGGDGLGLACYLADLFFDVTVWVDEKSASPENSANLKKMQAHPAIIYLVWPEKPVKTFDVIIDALLGTGQKGMLKEPYLTWVNHLNGMKGTRLSIDIPSGLSCDQLTQGPTFKANITLTIQHPKKAFFFSSNEHIIGRWHALDIGLHPDFPGLLLADTFLIEPNDCKKRLQLRSKFSHKGQAGHALIIAGSTGSLGAAYLAGLACLRSGCGKLTLHVPQMGFNVMQSNLPEALVSLDPHQTCWTQAPALTAYQAVAIGCGIGTNPLTLRALEDILKAIKNPLVLDADALNLLAAHPQLWSLIPPGSILTPHPGEFQRWAQEPLDEWEQWSFLREKCQTFGLYIILKGAYSRIGLPDGRILINTTGNSGMATAGSGDVLTGIIAGFLAQGYSSEDAAILGVHLHGLAGDLALETIGSPESLIASDIIGHLGLAFSNLRSAHD